MNPADMSFLIAILISASSSGNGEMPSLWSWSETSDTERCRGSNPSLRHFNVQYGEVPKLAEGAPSGRGRLPREGSNSFSASTGNRC